MKEINIQALIDALKTEQAKGVDTIVLKGDATLYSKQGNSVIITTVPQH